MYFIFWKVSRWAGDTAFTINWGQHFNFGCFHPFSPPTVCLVYESPRRLQQTIMLLYCNPVAYVDELFIRAQTMAYCFCTIFFFLFQKNKYSFPEWIAFKGLKIMFKNSWNFAGAQGLVKNILFHWSVEAKQMALWRHQCAHNCRIPLPTCMKIGGYVTSQDLQKSISKSNRKCTIKSMILNGLYRVWQILMIPYKTVSNCHSNIHCWIWVKGHMFDYIWLASIYLMYHNMKLLI